MSSSPPTKQISDATLSPIDAAASSTSGQLPPVVWTYGPCNQISSCSSNCNPMPQSPAQTAPCLTLTPNGWSANQFNPTFASGTALGSDCYQLPNLLGGKPNQNCNDLCRVMGEAVAVSNDVPLVIPTDYKPNVRPFSLNRLITKTSCSTDPTIENVLNGLKLKAGFKYLVSLSFESFHKTINSWARIAVLVNKQVVGYFNPITVSMGQIREIYPTYHESNRFIQATEDAELTVMPLAASSDNTELVELTNVVLQAMVVGMINNGC